MILSDFQLTYKQYGERSILIEWPSEIDKEILDDIIFYKIKLENSLFKDIIEIKSAYNSILISYIRTIENFYDKELVLKDLYSSELNILLKPSRLWKIGVLRG